ncbi:MAG: hypothetical protein ACJ8CR_17790 [Roseiflexaceae bacterium]
MPFNPILRLLFSAAPKDATLARQVGEFGAGLIGVSQLLAPATLGRALWVNLTARGAGPADAALNQPGTAR